MNNRNHLDKLKEWKKTKNIYLDWIAENKLKKLFSNQITFDGLSLWWVNSLTFKENMIEKKWYRDLNNKINFNKDVKSGNKFTFNITFHLRLLKNFFLITLWSILIRIISKTRNKKYNHNNVFHCYNYNFFKDKNFSDRCYGETPKVNGRDNLLLISIIKKKNFIINISNLKLIYNNYLVCDEYIKIKDIIIIYLNIYKNYLYLKKSLFKKKNFFIINNKNCENILKLKLLKSFSGEIQNSLINAIAIKESLKTISPKIFISYSKLSLARPIYFFINKYFKDIKIINYQHGHSTSNILFDNHRSKEFSKNKKLYGLNFSPAPDIFLTQGTQYNSIVKKFFKGKIFTIGSLKYDKKKFVISSKKNKKYKTILVCPSIGDEDDLLNYFIKTKKKNFKLILSPHPTFKNEVIKKFKKKLHNKFYVNTYDSYSTFELIKMSDLVVCGFSSVAFEASILGKKSLRALNLKNPIYNEYNDGIPFVFCQKDFDKMLNDENLIKLSKKNVLKNIKYYFYKLDNLSSKRFWKIIEKI